MQRQCGPIRFKLRTGPVPHGAPSADLVAVADTAEIAAVFDWRGTLELSGPKFPFDVPVRAALAGRGEEPAAARRRPDTPHPRPSKALGSGHPRLAVKIIKTSMLMGHPHNYQISSRPQALPL